MRPAWRTAAVLLIVAAVGAACGVKSPPLPAEVLLPDKVSPPSFEFMEDGLLAVTFGPPTKNRRGLPLGNLGGFRIERSENRLRPGFCPGCPVRYSKRLGIQAAPPPYGKRVAMVTYRFEDSLKPGFVYHFRFFAHDSKGNYDPAAFRTLMVYYDSPPRPPDDVKTMVEDNLVFLKWPPPERLMDGRPVTDLAGYDVYRRVGDEPWVKLNGGGPSGRPFFEDTLAVNERVYEYKVRAVRDWHGTMIAGPASPSVVASPVDLTPPPPPVKLFGAISGRTVRLAWTAVEVSDLAGYRVYRRRKDEPRFSRIGPDLVTDHMFIDGDVRPGHTYYYRITAVDGSTAANEGEPSVSVSVYFE